MHIIAVALYSAACIASAVSILAIAFMAERPRTVVDHATQLCRFGMAIAVFASMARITSGADIRGESMVLIVSLAIQLRIYLVRESEKAHAREARRARIASGEPERRA